MKLFTVTVFNNVEKYADAYLVSANDKFGAIVACKYRLDEETDEKAVGYSIIDVNEYHD